MATNKSDALTVVESGLKSNSRKSNGQLYTPSNHQAYVVGEVVVNDVMIFDITIPSNALVHKIETYSDVLDSDATETLAIDIGLAAKGKYTSVTSAVETKHDADDVIDADLFVDGSTSIGQDLDTNWVVQTPDAATWGPPEASKMVWELLGYDEDPHTHFQLALTNALGAATAAAGTCNVRVTYTMN